MSRINLLPDSYLRTVRRRRNRIRYSVAGLSLGLLGIVWTTIACQQIRHLTAEVATAAAQLEEDRQRLDELGQIEAECERLGTLLSVSDGVQTPVPATALVALFAELLPDSMALTRLAVEMPPPVIAPPSAAGRTSRTTTRQPERTESGRASPAAGVIRVELEGVALTRGDIARLMSTLSEHELFSNVTLTRSRNVTIPLPAQTGAGRGHTAAGASRVSFQIAMKVPVRARPPAGDVELSTAVHRLGDHSYSFAIVDFRSVIERQTRRPSMADRKSQIENLLIGGVTHAH